LLAARLGHPVAAMDAWQKATDIKPDQPNAHAYLAEGFDRQGESAPAARQWKEFLRLSADAGPDDSGAKAAGTAQATVQLADDEARLDQAQTALADYESGIAMAKRAGDAKLESVAQVRLADLQDKMGDARAAQESYKRGLLLDTKNGDPQSEGVDWFNYGQFLRRRGLGDELAFACFLRAEDLLASAKSGGPELETVLTARKEMESRLGKKAAAARRDRTALLARAVNLPPTSF